MTPSTLYFSDRPQRAVGHMSTADFVDLWGEGDNSFEEDPPNAVLAFLEPGDQVPEDAVVVINDPRLEDGSAHLRLRRPRGRGAVHAGPARCSSTRWPAALARVRRRRATTRTPARPLTAPAQRQWKWEARTGPCGLSAPSPRRRPDPRRRR